VTSRPLRENLPVIVVGRGPVGMTLALRLARYGVPTLLIDPQGPAIAPGSKAVLMHRQAAETLTPLGVGAPMVDEAVAWQISRTFYRDQELIETHLPPAGPDLLPTVMNLPQSRTEELLIAKVLTQPLITPLWEHRLLGLEQDGEGVVARLSGQGGEPTVRGSYLAGCDGARSTTRKLLGVPFPGYGHDDHFLIVDIRADLPFPSERRFWFDPPFNPGRTVLIHPQPDLLWHIDWQVGPGMDAEEEQRSGRHDERIRRVVGDVDYELEWMTGYQFKQLIADRFQVGRAFLVGDAAHLTSPYGARGLNSGFADADNLAWKLWLVVTGVAPRALLDTYEQERRPAAVENLRITGATARFMCPSTTRQRLQRNATLAAAARVPVLNRLVDSGSFYEPATYAGQPPADVCRRPGRAARTLSAVTRLLRRHPASRQPAPPSSGVMAPDGGCRVVPEDAGSASVPGSDGRSVVRLGQLLRDDFVALLFPGDGSVSTAHSELTKATRTWNDENATAPGSRDGAARPPLRSVLVTGYAEPRELRADANNVVVVGDLHGTLRRAYCPDGAPASGRLFVIRPDGYLAGHQDFVPAISLRDLPTRLGQLLSAASGMASHSAHTPPRQTPATRRSDHP